MKLKNIHGKDVVVNITKSNSGAKENTRQYKIVEIAQEVFPFQSALENFTIPGSRMSLDVFFPGILTAIEIQGEQHDEYIPFFHGNRNAKKFVSQVKRDSLKKEWCELNKINLIEIFPKEKEDDIRRKIIESSAEGRAGNIIRNRKI